MLSDAETVRLTELQAIGMFNLTADQMTEYRDLVARDDMPPAPTIAASDMPDHTAPDAAPDAPPSNPEILPAERLRMLRAKRDRSDAETSEMENLALAESEAAGHVAPPAPGPDSHEQAFVELMDHMLRTFEHIAAAVPSAIGVMSFVHAGRARLAALVANLAAK